MTLTPWFPRLLPLAVALSATLPAQKSHLHRNHLWTFDGAARYDSFGHGVDVVGDLDGDGHPDVAVGAPLTDDKTNADAGAVHVFSGRTGATLHLLAGAAAGDRLGFCVRGCGDVDKDGVPDLIVGVPGHDTTLEDAGAALVVSGRDGKTLRQLTGRTAKANFGNAVAGAGDVNADGWPDLIVGSIVDSTKGASCGAAYVFSGKDGQELHAFHGGPGDQMGVCVAPAGDADRDGHADLLVGAWRTATTSYKDVGSVYVFSGKTGGKLFDWQGTHEEGHFGNAASQAGDVNADGIGDFVVGAFFANTNLRHSGLVRVFSGKDGGLLYSFIGDKWDDTLGVCVCSAGDVNRDGYGDVAAGAWGNDVGGPEAGLVRVYSGKDGKVLHDFYGEAWDELGTSLALGDVNQDGAPDLVTGGQQYARLQEKNGIAQVLTVEPQYLWADGCCLSLKTGGNQKLVLDAGKPQAGRIYLVLGSITGTSPGIPLGRGLVLPLVPDAWFAATLSSPNLILATSLGFLDGEGKGQAAFVLSPGLDPKLSGLKLYHAYVAMQPGPIPELASNAVPVTLR